MTAKTRYDRLSSDRSQFLNTARQAADLTLPYLIRDDEVYTKGSVKLTTPWQSQGAKGVVTLASKLMLHCYLHKLASLSYRLMMLTYLKN